MSIRLIALQAFSGPDGTFAKDEPFERPADRAKFLTENGYAARLDKSEPAPPEQPEGGTAASAAKTNK